MKNAILNLYQRDYFTFYLVAILIDTILTVIFKIPILTLVILAIVCTLSIVDILRKFKKK